MKDWFKGGGSQEVSDFLAQELQTVMPSLRYQTMTTDSCVVSFTRSGQPLIYGQTPRLIALTGGNGAGAKCADELGRLGAEFAIHDHISSGNYITDFRP